MPVTLALFAHEKGRQVVNFQRQTGACILLAFKQEYKLRVAAST